MIQASDILAMIWANGDESFCARDEYDMDELQDLLDKSLIERLSGDEADKIRAELDYKPDDKAEVYKASCNDGDAIYFSLY